MRFKLLAAAAALIIVFALSGSVFATNSIIPAAGQVSSVNAAISSDTPVTPLSGVETDQTPANHFFWYLSRTSALAAYLLLFFNICLGICLKTRYLDPLCPRWLIFDLHQFTAILGGSLVLVHIFSLLGDSYFSFSVSELLIPGASPYRTFWTSLGVLGFYGGIVLALSSFIRKKIGQKTWRILHYVSFAAFFVILFHGIKTGTDSSAAWVQSLYLSTGTVVAFLSLWRFFSYRAEQAPGLNNRRTTGQGQT